MEEKDIQDEPLLQKKDTIEEYLDKKDEEENKKESKDSEINIENEKEDPKEIEINTNEKAVEEQEEDSDKLLEEKLVMKYSKEDIINVPDEFEGIRCPEAERYTYDPYLESNFINRFFFQEFNSE